MPNLILPENFRTDQFNLNNRIADSIDYFLVEISGKIQLSDSQRKKAEGHYEAIANVLRGSPENTLLNKLDVKMIPFGGFGSNTATKPFQGDEFDLDLIIRFMTTAHRFGGAKELYMEVWNALYNNKNYRDRIEAKDRCIRLYYSGDFYLELMPSVLTNQLESSTKLFVPERQADGSFEFELVDPVGLLNWFELKCGQQRHFVKNSMSDRGEFEVVPITTEDARKSILKQAVQLIKRARDVYFADDLETKKILKSVVILTMAGRVYTGGNNLYKLISEIVNAIDNLTFDFNSLRLENPINSSENFLESLSKKRDRYQKLRNFIKDFKAAFAELTQEGINLEVRKKQLSKLFGESIANTVLNEYADKMYRMNIDGKMKMNEAGFIGTSSAVISNSHKVQRHQFFGDK